MGDCCISYELLVPRGITAELVCMIDSAISARYTAVVYLRECTTPSLPGTVVAAAAEAGEELISFTAGWVSIN